MRLALKSNPKEVFHVERGVGLALLATGTVTEWKEPVTPVQTEVKWSIYTVGENGEFWPAAKAECPQCHQGFSCEMRLVPFRHCGRADQAPAYIAAEFARQVKNFQPKKKPAPPTNEGKIGWLS